MYRVVINIEFLQQPTKQFPGRNKQLRLDFVNKYECEDSWENLTCKAKITIPKNVFVKNEFGKPVNLGSTLTNIGGFSNESPIFLRGDKVTITAGYKYKNNKENEVKETTVLFNGYITKISPVVPIEIECENNMWILKQKQAPKKAFSKTDTVEEILRFMIQNAKLPFKVNALTKTTIGQFRTSSDETIAQVLARIKKDFHFFSYFRGDELRCGSLVYLEDEAVTQNFSFRQNIIDDELEYQRKDDIILSATASSVNRNQINEKTKSGHNKTKTESLKVFVYFQNGEYRDHVIKSGETPPAIEGGESRTLFFPFITDPKKLVALAKAELDHFLYTGLKGSFTTFGIPFVKHGDNANIIDPKMPERNGTYKIKGVEYTGGVNGLRQKIFLHYKIK
jgi:hypothetical protein